MDGPTLDALGGAITLIGGGLSKYWTDLFRGAWGGRLDKQPPWWAMAATAIICGLVGAGVAMWMLGINPFEHLSALFTYGTTSTSTAQATTMVHNKVRPMLAGPVVDTPQLAQVAKFEPSSPIIPEPDASATQVPLQVAPATVQVAPPAPGPSARDRILAAAASYEGRPYLFGGNGPDAFDCSGYVLRVLKDAGLELPGVRSAESIRQACTPIGLREVKPGDLLFFTGTYETADPATHIGISLGAGTMRMWNAVETKEGTGKPGVTVSDISTEYWQGKIFDARRHPALVDTLPAPIGLFPGIDVSNHQPRDLSDLIQRSGARHVVVKAYQTVEVAGGREHAKAQVASARANGCTVGMYLWLYQSVPIRQQVDDARSLAAEAGVTVSPLWLDIEPYTDGSCPTVAQIAEAIQYCGELGQYVGLYTGQWVWNRLGNPSGFAGIPLWIAAYDGKATLDAPALGGMTVVAKQFNDQLPDGTHLDLDVFSPEVCA